MSPQKVSWALTTKKCPNATQRNRYTDRFDSAEDIVYVAYLNKTFVEIIYSKLQIIAQNVDASRSSFTAVGRDSNGVIHFEFNFYGAGHFCIILFDPPFRYPYISFGCSPLQS